MIAFLEPGTKYGFAKIKFIRQKLIDSGMNLIAPCPNHLKCPMKKNDWCHFYVRIKRSKYHKYLKGATLGYEDEKFSYVIATKEKVLLPRSRAIRNTKVKNKEIDLTLCMDGKIKKERILKSEKSKFQKAKKTKWGDVFNDI